jgi:hypothetical protein
MRETKGERSLGGRPPIISEVDRPDRPRRSRPRRSRPRRSRPCRSRNICRVRWQRILSLSRIYACVRHGERVALTPPNGESGKGVNEGRRAADAFEKRAHIPTVCRRSLPGRPQCTDRRSGRPLRPETVRTCVANGGDRTDRTPACRAARPRPEARQSHMAYQWTKHAHPRATPPARFRAAFRGFAAVPHSGHSSGSGRGGRTSVNCYRLKCYRNQ